jgi:Bifunctional DNA primase/polymerase, N-terminal
MPNEVIKIGRLLQVRDARGKLSDKREVLDYLHRADGTIHMYVVKGHPPVKREDAIPVANGSDAQGLPATTSKPIAAQSNIESSSPADNVVHLKAMHPRGELAMQLARDGFRVFPLIVGGRTPALKKWPQHATRDLAQIRKWWTQRDYNIGICCGRADDANENELWLVVLDYDGKAGKVGGVTLEEHKRLGYTANVPMIKTPNGWHAYYWSKVRVSNSVSRVATHVDVRGYHGYVVGPGSVVKGVEYKRLTNSGTEPGELPDELLELARKPSDSAVRPEPTEPLDASTLDTPRARERATEYLINDAEESIENEGGDTTTYITACRVKDFGVSAEVCLELMWIYYNEQKCSPVWPLDDGTNKCLKAKVANAYGYGQNPIGIDSAEDQFADVFDLFKMEADEIGPEPDEPKRRKVLG